MDATANIPTPEQIAFGQRLRQARHRRGLTIYAIAGSTKVKAELFEALEAGDLSGWPRGLTRRAFFRQYAQAIGVPISLVLPEFARVHPDTHPGPGSASGGSPLNAEATARASVPAAAPENARPRASLTRAVGAALTDILVIGVPAVLLRSMGADLVAALASVALVYLALTAACRGESAATRAVERLGGGTAAIREWWRRAVVHARPR